MFSAIMYYVTINELYCFNSLWCSVQELLLATDTKNFCYSFFHVEYFIFLVTNADYLFSHYLFSCVRETSMRK